MNILIPGFEPPEDRNCTIWRYMNFTKFVDMLEHGGLFFTRADKLGDPFEGSWDKPFVLSESTIPAITVEGMTFPSYSGQAAFRMITKTGVVSCWHMNPYESDAMWARYGGTREAVVIKSTYQSLRASLPSAFRLGIVQYTLRDGQAPQDAPFTSDQVLEAARGLLSTIHLTPTPEIERMLLSVYQHERTTLDELLEVYRTLLPAAISASEQALTNLGSFEPTMAEFLLWPLLRKRKPFEHEREIRALTIPIEQLEVGQEDMMPSLPTVGIWQELDLTKLIEHVYVAPNAPDWFRELVKNVSNRYSLNVQVDPTTLDDSPQF